MFFVSLVLFIKKGETKILFKYSKKILFQIQEQELGEKLILSLLNLNQEIIKKK